MRKQCLKHFMETAGILVLASVSARAARNTRPADVTVYVSGDDSPPVPMESGARATVTWMYARIGIRLAWRNGSPGSGAVSGSPVTIQVRFTGQVPAGVSTEALARALPFGEAGIAIDVMYDRIRWVARRSNREAPILAHVLAHEIGHVLQGTASHAQTGVMKASWKGQDYDSMAQRPFEFTPDDVDLIVKGLAAWTSRIVEHSRP